jgi:hypothetical protein
LELVTSTELPNNCLSQAIQIFPPIAPFFVSVTQPSRCRRLTASDNIPESYPVFLKGIRSQLFDVIAVTIHSGDNH